MCEVVAMDFEKILTLVILSSCKSGFQKASEEMWWNTQHIPYGSGEDWKIP